MKIGLIPVNLTFPKVEMIVELAQRAEQIGLESLWTFEHVMVPLEYDSVYPYDKSGKMGGPPENNFVDPLICLSAIAAANPRPAVCETAHMASRPGM